MAGIMMVRSPSMATLQRISAVGESMRVLVAINGVMPFGDENATRTLS
ncbi:hypothetical protein Y788_21655 [Pantoea dispersa 625]|nr:hypothetical protein Y788_21655 [Pantoea dispersa 625]